MAKDMDIGEAIYLKGKYESEHSSDTEQETSIEKRIEKHTDKKKRHYRFTKFLKEYVDKGEISPKAYDIVKNCSNYLLFVTDSQIKKHKQVAGSSCRNRFCPSCSWRKSIKDAKELMVEMQYLASEEKKEFLHIVLTVPNVSGEQLESTITKINNAYKKLMQLEEIKAFSKGAIRKLEVTYNKTRCSKSYNTYHPHLHVLVAVEPNYFSSNSYLKHDRLLELWKQSMEDNSITQVFITRVGAEEDKVKDILEIAKYTAKSDDYLYNKKVFNTFYHALKGKQVMSRSGVFAVAHNKYKKGDLDYLKELDDTEYVYLKTYSWYYKKQTREFGYNQDKLRELDEEEYLRYNKHLNKGKDLDTQLSKSSTSTNFNQNS